MLYNDLVKKDIILSPDMQTAYDNFMSIYKTSFDANNTKRVTEESIRGFSDRHKNEIFINLAFNLGLCIYDEYNRGVNTTFTYYDTKYDFDTIRDSLGCHGISLNAVLASFGLFTSDIVYPSGYTFVVPGQNRFYMTFEGISITGGATPFVFNHGQNKKAMYCEVFFNDYSQGLKWSADDATYISDELNEVAIYSPTPLAHCSIVLGFNPS